MTLLSALLDCRCHTVDGGQRDLAYCHHCMDLYFPTQPGFMGHRWRPDIIYYTAQYCLICINFSNHYLFVYYQ